jgi:hypothetical protein
MVICMYNMIPVFFIVSSNLVDTDKRHENVYQTKISMVNEYRRFETIMVMWYIYKNRIVQGMIEFLIQIKKLILSLHMTYSHDYSALLEPHLWCNG